MKKICLYLIGHAPDAAYVKRLLDSASGSFDYVYYVDTTVVPDWMPGEPPTILELQDWARENSLETQVVHTRFSARDEDGVFDFSVARNRALDSAKETFTDAAWFYWLDLDDVLTPGSAERIRDAAETSDAEIIGWPYIVATADGLLRDRMTRRDFPGRWRERCHEMIWFKREEHKAEVRRDISVKHQPFPGKQNHLSHIQLLQHDLKHTNRKYLYIGKEFFNIQRYGEALANLQIYLSLPDGNPIEMYNAKLQVAKIHWITKNYTAMRSTLYEATDIEPGRREAFYYLAEEAFIRGAFPRALMFAQIAYNIAPTGWPLTEGIIEGWCTPALLYRCLHCCRRLEDAIRICQATIAQYPDVPQDIHEDLKQMLSDNPYAQNNRSHVPAIGPSPAG